ncbi:MAG: non-heme chloroperoxidase [Chloroflexi bacterium]|jgi:pimeloyl-ACP methyl ester carboxylesterase|nr:MAG: non-heme chloroperoxidase [Chloroflexota bacterium]
MSVDPKHSSLHQSAQKIGIPFTKYWNPIDRHIEANGLKLHFLEWGDPAKPTVVLLHGFAQSAHSFDFVSLSLADRFHVLALDFRGHGESDWSDSEDYTRESMQKDLEDFVIKTNSAPVIIVGLSLGGTIGYQYTAANQKLVRSLVIIDVAPRLQESGVQRVRKFVENKDYFDSIEEMVSAVQVFRPDRTKNQIVASVMRNAKQHADGRWSWKYDPVLKRQTSRYEQTEKDRMQLWKSLESITCPTLFVRGAESDVVSAETATELVSRMQNAIEVTVNGAGHLVTTDNPIGFIESIDPFLKSGL